MNKIVVRDPKRIIVRHPGVPGRPGPSNEGGGGGGVTDHGALTGLGDDDHLQYHTNARGDLRYDTLGAAAAAQAAAATDATTKANAAQAAAVQRANHTGTQAQATVVGLVADLAAKALQTDLDAEEAVRLAADLLLIPLTQKAAVNGVATLDGSGLIPTNQLPALAISATFVVANQAAQLALAAQVGDVAIRTDESKSYILRAEPATVLANWEWLLAPTDAVTSVEGRQGAVTLGDLYDALGAAAAAQAAAIQRGNHTGSQLAATISDFATAALAAVQSALDAKAPLASPAFSGNPTAPTPTAGDNDISVATTAFVGDAIDTAIDALPEVTSADTDHIVVAGSTVDIGPSVVRAVDSAYFTADVTIPGTAYVDLSVDVVVPAGMVCLVQGIWSYNANEADDIRLRLDLDQTLQECAINIDPTNPSIPLTADGVSHTAAGSNFFMQAMPISGFVQGHATLDTTLGFSASKALDGAADAVVRHFAIQLIQLSGL